MQGTENVAYVAMWAWVSPNEQEGMHGLLNKDFIISRVGELVLEGLAEGGSFHRDNQPTNIAE